MKRESAGLWVWRMIYPILIFIGVDTFLTMIIMYGYMFKELAAMQFVVDADNIKNHELFIFHRFILYNNQKCSAYSDLLFIYA